MLCKNIDCNQVSGIYIFKSYLLNENLQVTYIMIGEIEMNNKWYKHNLRVLYQDTDQMGVVHHANYVGWFEIARTEMIRNAGISYNEVEKLGLILPVLDINISYRQPAYYDDLLTIFTKITDFSPVRLEFAYEVRRANEELEDEGDLLATCSTLHMWLDKKWKRTRIDQSAPKLFELIKQNSN